MKKIKLSMYTDVGDIPKDRVKDLISALVLCGYTVWEHDEQVIFELGNTDSVEVIE